MKAWAVPEKPPILTWATNYRHFSEQASALPGKYSALHTPWIPHILDALNDKDTREVWLLKSAGVSHTEGIINNWLGWIIDVDPSGILGLFPKEDLCTKFIDEKFIPMVKSTKRLHKKIDVFTRRKNGNRALYKKFHGGFLSLITANVIANVQSTHLKRAFIEEPDRCSTNASGQGSPISSLRDRLKTYPDSKLVGGGSPGIKGLSVTEDEYLAGDQRKFYVPCHDCGQSHVLHWDNVHWDSNTNNPPDEVYGHALPSTAFYSCPHCGSVWSNTQKNINVRKLTCEASKPFNGIASFYINALYSSFPGDTLAELVKRYLKALRKSEEGDQSLMIVFVTTALGLPYEYKSDNPETDELEKRAENYAELTVPRGGLVLTAGVDVQDDRLAVQIIAKGRGDETWIIYWGELFGNVTDANDPVWQALADFLFAPIRHSNGTQLFIRATSIDAGDGGNSENVYKFVRKYQSRGVLAIRGSSQDYGTKEIFSKPKPLDTKGRNNTKSSKYGLLVYMVGTHKAKDLIYSRLKLTGNGAGRIHYYQNIRADYFEQLLSEIKVPSRNQRGKESYEKKSGVRNEGLDSLVYAEHAARSLGVHLWTETRWQKAESDLMQASIFDDQPPAEIEPLQTLIDSELNNNTPPPLKQSNAPRIIKMKQRDYQ